VRRPIRLWQPATVGQRCGLCFLLVSLAFPETESDRERAHAFRVQTPSILDEFGRIHAPNFRKRMAFQKKKLKIRNIELWNRKVHSTEPFAQYFLSILLSLWVVSFE
jgi:hypothetical protein